MRYTRQFCVETGDSKALLSHNHYFIKALVGGSHIFKGFFIVLVMNWQDF